MKILLLCNYDPYNAAMVSDHINAFALYSNHEVVVYTDLVRDYGSLPENFPLHLFDAVVIHYSIFLAVDAYISTSTRRRLKAYQGVKGIFLQDEYRFVDASVQRIADVGFNVIFTCVPENAIEQVYPAMKLPGVRRVNVLTGYVSEFLLAYKPRPIKKRKYDVSYRSRRYPAWHGRLGLEKWEIAKKFLADAPRFGLRCNISFRESDRVYGAEWVDLLQQSKAVLGVESGASVFDFTGEVSGRVETVVSLLGHKVASYQLLRERYFSDIEDKIPLAQISPRIFEAIALRTLCVLYEGEYSGILKPWRHYVPLKKDHSNMEEVAAVLKDPARISEIVADAYSEVALNPQYSYRTFVGRVDTILEEIHASMPRQPAGKNEAQGSEEQTIEGVRKQHPFYLIANPHGLRLTSSTTRRIVGRLKTVLPAGLKRRIRALVR